MKLPWTPAHLQKKRLLVRALRAFIFIYFLHPSPSKKDVLKADALLVYVIVPAVMRAAVAEFAAVAGAALFAFVAEIGAEDSEVVLPDVFQTVFENVALCQLRAALDVKAGENIPVGGNAGGVDARVA